MAGTAALSEPLVVPEEEKHGSCFNRVVKPFVAMLVFVFVVCFSLDYFLLRACLDDNPETWCDLGKFGGDFNKKQIEKHPMEFMFGWQSLAIAATVLAVGNALHHIYQHMLYNENAPAMRCHVLTILSVVPVYSCCSCLAVTRVTSKLDVSVPMNMVREFYEAMVLIAFVQFVAAFWGGSVELANRFANEEVTFGNLLPHKVLHRLEYWLKPLEEKFNGKVKNIRAFPWARAPGSEYIASTFFGILQYAIVMVAFAVIHDIMWTMHLYGYDVPHEKTIARVFKVLKLASNGWAMWNLVTLYDFLIENERTSERMLKILPGTKFFCVKMIVLFSVWQENILKMLAQHGYLNFEMFATWSWNHNLEDSEKLADVAVNFLVCMEMLLFSQWHRYAYSYNEDLSPPPLSPHMKQSTNYWKAGTFKMIEDIRHLYFDRARGQRQAIKLILDGRKNNHMDLVKFKEVWPHFDLDANQEAPIAQMLFMIVKGGLERHEWASKILHDKDVDFNHSLNFSEATAAINELILEKSTTRRTTL